MFRSKPIIFRRSQQNLKIHYHVRFNAVFLNSVNPMWLVIYTTRFKIKTFYVLPTLSLIQVRSLSNPCEICGAQSSIVTGLSPSTSNLPCQYHSINAPHSSSSTLFSYQKDKRAKPRNLTKRNVLSEIWKH